VPRLSPRRIAIDCAANLFIADTNANRIQRVAGTQAAGAVVGPGGNLVMTSSDGCSQDAGVVEGPRMHRRRRNLIAIGFVAFLAGWLAWKVLLTKSKIPASPPAARTERPM